MPFPFFIVFRIRIAFPFFGDDVYDERSLMLLGTFKYLDQFADVMSVYRSDIVNVQFCKTILRYHLFLQRVFYAEHRF